MKKIGTFEAKNQLSALIDLVAQGEDVVITRHGKPVAWLVPPEGALRKQDAAAAAERIRENAKAERLGRFDWVEWKAFRDEGRR
jgi:prevent-host-death family protein